MAMEEKPKYNYELRQLPLIAGLLAPLSLLMSIPPLTGSWESEDFYHVSNESNHSLLILSLLIVGLICLLIANIALLARIWGKRIIINTWLAIIFYFISFALTLASGLIFKASHKLKKNRIYSGEYYTAYLSCIISLLVSIVLLIDYVKNNKLRRMGAGLSSNQRVLIFMMIVVTIWVILGALTFRYCEGWTFTRGIYVVLVTSSTIGFGDYFPSTIAGRVVCMVYSGVGIVLVGMLLAYINSVMLESFEAVFYQQLERLGTFSMDSINILMDQYISKEKTLIDNAIISKEGTLNREKSVYEHEDDLENAKIKQYMRHLKFSSISLLLFWILGAGIFCYIESWDYFTAFYFCYVSFTTIGYGDVTVETFPGLIVFCIYVIVGLVTMAYFISVISELFSYLINARGDRISRIKKRKRKMAQNKRIKTLVESIGDPFSHVELIKVLDFDSGNEEQDQIQRLLSMTEFYHKEVGSIVQALIKEANFRMGEEHGFSGILLDKMSNYDKLYDQILELCKQRLTNEEVEEVEEELTIFELDEAPDYS